MDTLKSVAKALLIAVALLALVGCNTVEGLGKDVEKGGEAIQDAAD